ncbi:efflux RND transporter periplasmic adaptor subunit [Pedobacter sp. JCM 36344]|uniref:efflux RND transporter periplasmic adaptor subunit n=1 Tax=Pedobacter sp. JCM 36344 TaxID=3374280 RepID=UPI00397E6E1A
MDKSIEVEVTKQRNKKRTLVITIVVVLIVLGVFGVRAFIQPSITRAEFTSAVVGVGDIENTINASGEVLPEFEEVLTSPINAALRDVLMDVGMKINAGQSILTLDKSAAQTEYDKLGFLIESKENEIRKLKLDLTKTFYDIKSNNSIKQLRISNFKDAVSSAKRLFNVGGGTKEDIDQSELDLKVAELEKQQIENEIRSKQQTMKIEIREAEISLAIQRNDQSALTRKLKLADIIATRDGVITWVNKNIGASVKEGESLARIANLTDYKVAGSISDMQLEDLRNGMPAIIRINDTQLRGSINKIFPAVNNSIVSFEVRLNEKDSKLLRPNMKVDVFLVTATRNKVLRVPNGPAFKGSNEQVVFVLKNGKAEQRLVKLGLSNFDFVEILNGLRQRDEVITSDMKEYENAKQIIIK